MNIKISADSTVDLSQELISQFDISIMPLIVTLGDESKLDGVEVSAQELFDYVEKTKELPKTASPSIMAYQEFFDKQLQNADCVIHFVVSGMMSSCYNSAKKAAEEYGERVFVVDSRSLSTGIALLCLSACDMAKEGKSPQEIVDKCKALTKHINASFILGDLEYMHKGGRCSGAARLSSKFLRIKPMIYVIGGEMKVGKKYMGKLDRVIDAYIADTLDSFENIDTKRVFITHTPIDNEIIELAKFRLQGKFENVYDTSAGATISSHCGLETLGILFIGDRKEK